jgi:hypothetical protein
MLSTPHRSRSRAATIAAAASSAWMNEKTAPPASDDRELPGVRLARGGDQVRRPFAAQTVGARNVARDVARG